MEQSSVAAIPDPLPDAAPGSGPGASRSVYRGIMRALETQRIVPGQRLIETELALDHGVGRNAIREALQWLAARGVIDVIRHRSSAIRKLDPAEALEVLDVAEGMIALAASAAARAPSAENRTRLDGPLRELERAAEDSDPAGFDRARRHFHRALIAIGGNRELERLFPALGLHILYAQHRGAALRRDRLDDFRAVTAAVRLGDRHAAETSARHHIEQLRQAVRSAPR